MATMITATITDDNTILLTVAVAYCERNSDTWSCNICLTLRNSIGSSSSTRHTTESEQKTQLFAKNIVFLKRISK